MSNKIPPIWYPHEAFYIEAMLFLTESAMDSANRLEEIIKRIDAGDKADNTNGVLNDCQNIVHRAGALSRYFWPVRKAYEGRGEYLRKIFSIEKHCLLKDRDLRNWMEHFDEKLDDCMKEFMAGVIVPSYLGPEPPKDGVPSHIFRAYYCDTGIFEILGMKIELQPLVNEIMCIHDQLVECSDNGMRFPPQKNKQ